MKNLLISLYDYTGNQSGPYEYAGWEVIRIDIQNGQDILTWEYRYINKNRKVIIIAAQPCDDYAVCGAKHFAKKDAEGVTEKSQVLVKKTKEIIDWFNPFAWMMENPKTRIHKLNPWIGQRPVFIFNPCDFAGWSPKPDEERYNKETWLFGKFNSPPKFRLEPFTKHSPIWSDFGGKSLKTKNARSITPKGFAHAFFMANN